MCWNVFVCCERGASVTVIGGGLYFFNRKMFRTHGTNDSRSGFGKRELTRTRGVCASSLLDKFAIPDHSHDDFRFGLDNSSPSVLSDGIVIIFIQYHEPFGEHQGQPRLVLEAADKKIVKCIPMLKFSAR